MQETKSIERDARDRIPELLSDLLDEPVQLEPLWAQGGPDGTFEDRSGRLWLFETKATSSPGVVTRAAEQMRALAARLPHAPDLWVVVVPYMSAGGARAAERAGASWMDLSGNASITAEGLRVFVSGRPNAFPAVGRPSSPFAPRSARIARTLLLDPGRWWRQKDLAVATDLDDGQVSRVVRRLRDERMLEARDREVRPADAGLLLDAWSDQYRFDRHDVVLGHVTGTGMAVSRHLAERLASRSLRHAFTGLPAAWAIDHFATFRLTTVYVDGDPRTAAKAVELRRETRGANVQLVGPNDAGVFAGSRAYDGLVCVSPAQAYLDLLHLPERAPDAAEHLCSRMGWSRDAS
jgi:hypothetical protein